MPDPDRPAPDYLARLHDAMRRDVKTFHKIIGARPAPDRPAPDGRVPPATDEEVEEFRRIIREFDPGEERDVRILARLDAERARADRAEAERETAKLHHASALDALREAMEECGKLQEEMACGHPWACENETDGHKWCAACFDRELHLAAFKKEALEVARELGAEFREERKAAVAERDAARAVLREVEWSAQYLHGHGWEPSCLWCRRAQYEGHAPGCTLRAALGEGG